jgi:molybdenum cofactor biosynthesis protein B
MDDHPPGHIIDQTRTFVPVQVAVATISDSRTPQTDTSGDTLVNRLTGAGHILIDRRIITDDVDAITAALTEWIDDPRIDVVITTGGTGVTGRDVTPEAYARVIEKQIEGFGELFRMLSYRKIGTSTMQSRALGGVARGTYLFALPGSTGACKDGWDDILRWQLDSRHQPCNLVELMPRLKER